MRNYQEFLRSKAAVVPMRGLRDVPALPAHLFPFQQHCVDFLLRVGCGALFLDTGLGKTRCQLEWAEHARRHSNGWALILTPLAVAGQIEREGRSLGYDCRVIREQSDAREGINICNYDRLQKLDPDAFGAVSLDEASILKSFTGKTTQALISAFHAHHWKLVATATPAPNDHMELGNYAEFLSIMAANEMLSRFFINDTSTASQQWRLKGHAVVPFWNWMASWARMAEKPSDLGDADDGFILPDLQIKRHQAEEKHKDLSKLGDLFGSTKLSATNLHTVKRDTANSRADIVAELVAKEPNESWVLWCDTDYEADALSGAVPSAIEVRGSQSIDQKEELLSAFSSGEAKHLIAKPSMCGYGLNWQHCARMAFVGRSYSYETYYQAVRRCWRFGQKRPVRVHLVVATGENEIGRTIDRKAGGHAEMKSTMRAAMRRAAGAKTVKKTAYVATHKAEVPAWLKSAV
jgi:hypothetical protein